MDYPVSGKNPDVAQAMVPHSLNGDGTVSAGGPQPLRASQTPAITAGTAYAAGNAVGGLLVFANMVLNGGAVLQSAVLRDKAGQNVAYDLFLFDSAPAAPTDRSAVSLSAADLARCVGVVSFAGMTLGAASTMGVITVSPGLAVRPAGGSTLWGILVTRGAPTYAGSTDLSLDLLTLPF